VDVATAAPVDQRQQPRLPVQLLRLRDRTTIENDFCLNPTFLRQVDDPDKSFRFNYCE
jgi:hypothetical protein